MVLSFLAGNQTFVFGETVYPNGGRYGALRLSYLSLIMVHDGAAEIHVDGIEHIVNAGRTALVHNRQSLELRFPSGRPTRLGWCETAPPPRTQDPRLDSPELPGDVETSRRLSSLQQLGIELGQLSGRAINNLRNALGTALFTAYFFEARRNEMERAMPNAVIRAKHYLDEHFTSPCDLAALSAIAAVSPQHLIHLFRKHLDTTPIRYLWRLRTIKGIQLLQQTGLSVTEIAYQCGFKNPYHFSRHVRRHSGMTPTEIQRRKAYRQPSDALEQVEDVCY